MTSSPRLLHLGAAAATVMVVLASACGGAAVDPATPAPVTVAVPEALAAPSDGSARPVDENQFRCAVELRALGPLLTGEASGGTNESLAEEAEREVCKKLWKASKTDCKDPDQVVTLSRQTRLTIINGKAKHTARVLMRAVGKTYRGTASSPQSGNDACRRAVNDACIKAPPQNECSSQGLYCSPSEEDPMSWSCSVKPPAPSPTRRPSPFEA